MDALNFTYVLQLTNLTRGSRGVECRHGMSTIFILFISPYDQKMGCRHFLFWNISGCCRQKNGMATFVDIPKKMGCRQKILPAAPFCQHFYFFTFLKRSHRDKLKNTVFTAKNDDFWPKKHFSKKKFRRRREKFLRGTSYFLGFRK